MQSLKLEQQNAAERPTTKKVSTDDAATAETAGDSVVENPDGVACDSCEQRPDIDDWQCDPSRKKNVRWAKVHKTITNNKARKIVKSIAYGKECYPCMYVRKKFWLKPLRSQPELIRLRREDAKEDDKFWAVKQDCVQKTRAFVTAADVDAVYSTASKETDYRDRFVSGSFQPLFEFADERRLSYEDEDSLIGLVQHKYPSYIGVRR